MGLRSGIIIASNLVVSIFVTLIIMFVWSIDLQRVSLSALILVVGMIVDIAIVVTDGVLVNMQHGQDPMIAVGNPARQTA